MNSIRGSKKTDSSPLKSIRVAPPAQPADNMALGKQLRNIVDRSAQPKSTAMDLYVKIAGASRVGSWILCGISLFCFSVLVVTPFFLPLLSFGSCFSEGLADWKEFTYTALHMSVTPALLASASAAFAFAMKYAIVALEQKAAEDRKHGQELRMLEEMIKPTA